jgi:hypothetical protein
MREPYRFAAAFDATLVVSFSDAREVLAKSGER